MIESFPNIKTLSSPGPNPTILFTRRAVLPCGCFVVAGKREDNYEAATGAVPCSERHQPMISRFQRALTRSLERPEDRPLVEVVDELLEEAAANAAA